MRVKAPYIKSLESNKLKIISLFTAFFLLLYPIWLITTSVYRSQLPSIPDKLKNLNSLPCFLLKLKFTGLQGGQSALDMLKDKLNEKLNHSQEGAYCLKPHFVDECDIQDLGCISILINHNSKQTNQIEVLPNNAVIFKFNDSIKSSKNNDEIAKISNTLSQLLSYNRNIRNSKHLAIPYKKKIQISLHLLSMSEFEKAEDWEIETAVQKYLKPFIDKLSNIYNISITSNIQLYSFTQLDFGKKNLSLDDLSVFVNSEWNLASVLSDGFELNFIVYAKNGSTKEDGLVVDGQTVEGFLLPRQGGVYILNRDTKKDSIAAVDLADAFKVFISQLRTVLDIHETTHGDKLEDVVMIQDGIGISDWELVDLIRRKTAENLQSGVNTLISLTRMLNNLQNIVIDDHISERTAKSIQYMLIGYDNINNSYKDLLNVFEVVRRGQELAEEVFFDYGMVGMLYFPDEHLYAVYAPLFFPIIVPVVISIFREVRERFGKK